LFLFSAGVVIAVRLCRWTGTCEGEIPIHLLCFGLLFLLVTSRGPRTGRFTVLPRRNDTGEFWLHHPGQISHPSDDVAEQREGWLQNLRRRCYTQKCANECRCVPERNESEVPVGIFLSTIHDGVKERRPEPSPGRLFVFVLY
jgi:hypothetical protein